MKKTKKTSSKEGRGGKASLFIVGDSPLVDEYAELCSSRGYDVFVQWNNDPSGKNKSRPKGIRQASSIPTTTSLALELTNSDIDLKRTNIGRLDKALAPASAILSASITVTATEQSSWIKGKHRLVGIGALPGFSDRSLIETAPTVFTPSETIEVARTFFRSIGKDIEIVQDRVGMVFARILCQIINESVFALQEDVATPADLDTAMKLGVNYPMGPIEWADKIGFENVYSVLSALEQDLQEDRYRIAPLLKQMAQGGRWWTSSKERSV